MRAASEPVEGDHLPEVPFTPFAFRATPVTVDAVGLREGGRSIAKPGPKTENGKRASSRNAHKHGLRTESIDPVIIGIESAGEWKAHLDGMVESLEPEGYHETEMAVRIAEILWRLRRVTKYEAEHLRVVINGLPDEMAAMARYAEKVLGTPKEEFITPERVDMQVGNRLVPSPDVVAKIARFEAHLHRMYIQTLHELEALQARRNGERVPLTRLDISGPPAG